MYTMLLAANSWPGPQLAEHKGNPLVHEILERLGLLEHEKDIDFELEAGEYDHDHQPSSDEALTVDSPHVSQRGTEQSPEPQSPEPSACPSRLAHRECPFTEADDTINFNAWHTRPMHSHFDQFAFLPSQLPPEFSLEPPPRMVQSLSSTSQSTHSVDATDWTAVDCTSAWWQDVSRTVQARSCSSVGSIPALFATHMAVGNDSNPASYARNSFLVDPGVYASDFDVER